MKIPLHAVLVHFPIALFVTSLILDGLGLFLRRPKLQYAAWINLLLSGVSVLLAIGSGLLEKRLLNVSPVARSTLDTHETFAFLIAVIILGLLLWRFGNKGNLPDKFRLVYIIFSLTGLVFLYFGSSYGGKLVYQYGVGTHQSRSLHPLPVDTAKPSPDSVQILFFPPADTSR